MRVTQYNALAQCYVRSAQFPHSPSSALTCGRAPPPHPGADHDRALAIVHPRARAPDARPPPRPTPPSPPRRWKARSKALADELASIDADVLALQELDQYDDFWRPKLEAMGYAGWFCKRTECTAPKKDGCGLFYKRDAFELIARRDVQFNDLAVSHLGPGERARRAREAAEAQTLRATGARAGNDGTRRPSEPSEKLDPLRNDDATPSDSDSESVPPPEDARFVRDCVATMALLVAKEKETGGDEKRKGRPVLVASAHLFWDPAHADVKLAQAERLLAEAADFLRAEAEAEGGRLSGRASDDESALASSSATRARLVADSTPIVLAGDFNSVPGSDVHARALRGVLLPRAEAENAEGYEGAEARDRSLRYRSLRSAYADAMASGSVSSAGLRPGETAVGFREGGSPGGEGSDPRGSGSPLEPAHTTVTPGFTDCIDYVFVSEDVEVLGAEAIPGVGDALAAGLPNANRPSDHLPVTVRLAF